MQPDISLRNHLLIAMPNLRDPYFEHTVTLICQHDEEGAFGVTINRPTTISLGELLTQLDIEVGDPQVAKRMALSGGPIQVEQGFVLHDSPQHWESTMQIAPDLFLTSSKDILVELAKGREPQNFLLLLGCAGWEAGQLDLEIKENTWLTCPATVDLLFTMPYPHRWQGAAATLGIDVNLLSVVAGHA